MKALIAYFAHHKLFVNLLTIFILVAGLTSLSLIRRELFPNISFEVITVRTIYPGASALDIEKAITIPLEEDLKEIDSVRKLTSVSTQSTSVIVIQLDPDEADEQKAKEDIQDIVNRWEDLPEGAEKPTVTLIESKMTPLLGISVSGPSGASGPEDYGAIREIAKRLERELANLDGIAKVEPQALDDKEIRVEVKPRAMRRYRVSLEEVIQALKMRNISAPGGYLEAAPPINVEAAPHSTLSNPLAQSEEFVIRTYGEFESIDDVRNAVVRSNDLGEPIRIGDIADLELTTAKPTILSRTNGRRDIMLTLLKSTNEDAIDLTERVEAFIGIKQQELQNLATLEIVDDKSFIIKNRLNVLSENLFWGVLFVVFILSLLLSLKVSFLVSLSIPLSFFATVTILYLAGFTLNVVSLMGLIIVSGFLTDNAVVIVDNISNFLKRGHSVQQAAVEGTYQVWRSITASTLTSIIAFFPMLIMTGIFGKVIFAIPLGIITALACSLLVGFLMLPSHFISLVRVGDMVASHKQGTWSRFLERISSWWDDRVCVAYQRVLRKIVTHRYRVLILSMIGMVVIAGLCLSTMKKVLFPAGGIEIFFIKTEAPVGTPLELHAKWIEPLEVLLQKEIRKEELINFWTKVGLQQKDITDPESKRGSEYAQIAVYLTPETQRERSAETIIASLRSKMAEIKGPLRDVFFEQVKGGPPVGKPVSLGIRGERFEDIVEVSEYLKEQLRQMSGVTDIRDSYVPGKKEIRVIVNHAEIAAAGLSVASIGRTIFAAFEGIEATTIRELTDETKIRVLLPQADRSNRKELEGLLIQTKSGELVPLKSFATFKEGTSLASVEHENRRRQIKVTAEVDLNITSSDRVNESLRERLPDLNRMFPRTTIDFGGEDQDSRESFAALERAFGIAIVGILMVLILTFGSVLQPFLVLITIPFAVVSALIAFFIHGLPLSFLGTMGMIALAGVIVNNAIVLIDFVNQARTAGLDRFESIYEAGGRRLRAIFLTTVTTVVGVLPTAYGLGGMDRFVVPIAISLGWGLALGSIMTAFLFPAALAILDDFQDKIGKRFKFR